VIAELMLTMPIFPGESGVDQIVEIIKILGTPTKDEIKAMNPNYDEYRFPQISPIPWDKVFKPNTSPDAIKFVSSLLVYDPEKRPNPLVALQDRYFD
jgi:serine/threonine protein kinase